ncbi:MAG: N-acetylmuramoyl-L-alanine amidase [Burkholderiales bacterium]|nr:N-acetylmuramoyl-L-alanine amidase [Burkholderiales bacterium]
MSARRAAAAAAAGAGAGAAAGAGADRARVALALGALLLGACAPLPRYSDLAMSQRPSPNFNERRPSFVVLHHTGNSNASRALGTLTDPATQVSAHFLVERDGAIRYLVDELKRAWHAGPAWWGGPLDMNSASIGIELDNDGAEPYPKAQIEALLALLADLRQRYRVPAPNFLAHGDIAPGRKVDPGVNFPWKLLAAHGFGPWCDPPFDPAPAGLDAGTLLGALGYDVSDYEAAVGAFKRRFAGTESRQMDEEDRSRLYCLLLRKWAARGD